MHGYVLLGDPSHLYLDPWELEVYISHVCLSGAKAMNHVSSSQTNSFCEEKKQTNESSIMYVGADSTKTVPEVCPVSEEWPKLFKGL